MTRLFSLFVLAIVLWIFLEIGWAKLKTRLGPRGTTELVRCARCGDYVPRGHLAEMGGTLLCERCRA